jgi:diazepam-binding inhibitor (GABA receptor modulating acyl-CoA-binding protein)
MSDLAHEFEKAAEEAQKLDKKPDNNTLLILYALYKQSTKGDISNKRPGFTDVVGRAKFDAWAKLKGVSKEQAMQSYVDLVKKLKG